MASDKVHVTSVPANTKMIKSNMLCPRAFIQAFVCHLSRALDGKLCNVPDMPDCAGNIHAQQYYGE